MKKIISLILSLLMVLSLTVTVSAEETVVKGYTLTPSSEMPACPKGRLTDGNKSTYWHSDYSHDGKEFTFIAGEPHSFYYEFTQPTAVSGFIYTPRQDKDQTAGIWNAYEVYGSADGETWVQLHEGTFEWGTGYEDRSDRKVSWGDYTVKLLQIEVPKANGGFCTAGEIQLLQGGAGTIINNNKTINVEPPFKPEEDKEEFLGEYLENDGWKVSANSSQPSNGIGLAFDGKENTFWHTDYEVIDGNAIPGELPYFITVIFPEVKEISGVTVVPRTINDVGRWQNVKIYKADNDTDFEFLYEGNMKVSPGVYKPTSISWGKETMKAIKIELTNPLGGFGTAAEIKFFKGTERDKRTFDFSKWDVKAKSQKLENSCAPGWGNVRNILDGVPNSKWHAYYEAEGSVVKNLDPGPYEINMILPEKDTIEGYTYTPRNDAGAGRILEFNINVSAEDEGPYTTIYTGRKTVTEADTEVMNFGIAVEVKRIQIEIVSCEGNYGAMSDFVFTPGQYGTPVVPVENFKEEFENRYNYPIDPSKFTAKANIGSYQGSKVGHMFDGMGTAWNSEHSTKPVIIEVDLGAKHIFNTMVFSPRQSNTFVGYWDEFNMLVSNDGKKYTEVLENYSFEKKNLKNKEIKFEKPIATRYVAFVVNKYTGNRVGAAEIRFLQTKAEREAEAEFAESYVLQVGSNIIKKVQEENVTETQIDVAPYITSVGATLIPLRGLLEQLGATITWNGDDQSIKVVSDKTTIEMKIGDPRVYIENSDGKVRYTMTTYPRIKNGRTYIPLRFVSEHLGYDVLWNGATQEITIK